MQFNKQTHTHTHIILFGRCITSDQRSRRGDPYPYPPNSAGDVSRGGEGDVSRKTKNNHPLEHPLPSPNRMGWHCGHCGHVLSFSSLFTHTNDTADNTKGNNVCYILLYGTIQHNSHRNHRPAAVPVGSPVRRGAEAKVGGRTPSDPGHASVGISHHHRRVAAVAERRAVSLTVGRGHSRGRRGRLHLRRRRRRRRPPGDVYGPSPPLSRRWPSKSPASPWLVVVESDQSRQCKK